ncbi:amylo-alpha-1,6-glucosidase [Aeoliella sp. ICT_H6.2]|uniref:Amylo-alpha-1,6-glucosidase n=1 Tax=Aeoliella straminimaris TaxID=2954799 RepID=A0A9X2FE51_9BACT|nr:amylo-alpha-1,6-glucosidase [Aeoliella straminimaris]
MPEQRATELVTRKPAWSSDPATLASQLLEREWLVTLGNGGYASGTVGGPPSRRHHGLLIAGLPAPYGRTHTLSHVREEVISSDGSRERLWGQHLLGESPELHGSENFESFFLQQGLPNWHYRVANTLIQKRIVPAFRENTLAVCYEVLDGDEAVSLDLRPMIQFRGHDAPVNTPVENGEWSFRTDGQVEVLASNANTPLRLRLDGMDFRCCDDELRIENSYYGIEDERGYDHVGSLWSPGRMLATLTAASPICLLVSTEPWLTFSKHSMEKLTQREMDRRDKLLEIGTQATSRLHRELVLAADQFLIRPAYRAADHKQMQGQHSHPDRRSVIAGYPWFTDWGRDTMISLPGLALSTGRFDEARRILLTFADYVRDGLIPNLFPEGANVGMYHTADATLWFFQALAAYHNCRDDGELMAELQPVLTEIIGAHIGGTHYGIGVDANDGLLRQGAPDVQLTWMDAKVGDWVVTPRRGKAVEINALWFNALRHYEQWMKTLGHERLANEARQAADRAFKSFNQRFWFASGRYLYDVVDGESGDDQSLRPNQLFAISLAYPVLARQHWQAVVERVSAELFTPVGLRSLAPSDPEYKGDYTGDVWARDAAYHQGTAWSWLLGPYLEACGKLEVEPQEFKSRIYEALDRHLSEACIGQVSEVFDGNAPHMPRGCFAQAWSVAELLRTEVGTAL